MSEKTRREEVWPLCLVFDWDSGVVAGKGGSERGRGGGRGEGGRGGGRDMQEIACTAIEPRPLH